MDASAVANILEPLRPEMKALGVKRLLLVGSVATGKNGPDSDVDFVVEFDGPAKFSPYMGLIELLERALSRKIDLITLKALRSEIAPDVLAEARTVA